MTRSSGDAGRDHRLAPAISEAYDETRDPGVDTGLVCHAPGVNLNFEQNGNVTACCYNRSQVLGTWPEQSISEIWNGAPADELRTAIRDLDFSKGCELCLGQLQTGNFAGTRMRQFDPYSVGGVDGRHPRVMEFELTNTCNLECVMCTGYYSSMIRKHREKLPPLASPYDDRFVDQLEPFLPHLREAKFLGGEPFLTRIYFAIWERIREHNPKLPLVVTTNATTRNEKVETLLAALDFRIIISIDSLERDTYEAIRKRASYDEVMENLGYFRDYMHAKGHPLWLTVCPMQQNWREIPAILDFCNANRTRVFFNTVLYPAQCSLRTLSASQLDEVLALYRAWVPSSDHDWQRANHACLEDLMHQLDGWRQVASEKEEIRARLSGADGARLAADAWTLRVHDGARARADVDRPGDAISIARDGPPTDAPWQVHVFQPVELKAGVLYLLRFRARAERESRIIVTAKLGRPPWDSAGLYEEIAVGTEWETREINFLATDSSETDRISFEVGGVSGRIEIGAVAVTEDRQPENQFLYELRYPV